MAQSISSQDTLGQDTDNGQGRTLDNTGNCLLSLDGGGVRGLSTLYILQTIMTRLNYEREQAGFRIAKKPCEIFDLIGGTSTGGLIAIMLGRLEMSVEECIEAYTTMMKHVFEKKKNRSVIDIIGNVKPRFSSKALQEAIEQVLRENGKAANELLDNGEHRRCRVFVCTKTQETSKITRMRSYRSAAAGVVRNPTIVEAALATSAAPTYFDPIMIEGSKYVDGAIGANNPAMEVEEEASDIWCEKEGNIQPMVKCFISVGTGHPGIRSVSDKGMKALLKTLRKEATETEDTNHKFHGRWRQHFDNHRCFRFNVDHGLEDVGLAEYAEHAKIKGATSTYLETRRTMGDVRHCVENLRLKEYQPDREFMERVKSQINREQRPIQTMARATSSEISELTRMGNMHFKISEDRITMKDLLQARHYFSKAMYYYESDPQTSPKQVARLCQKLADTSLRLSFKANRQDRMAHVEDAKSYASAGLDNALKERDECMAAQFDFLLACVKARKVYIEARRMGMGPNRHPEREDVATCITERLDAMRQFANLDIATLEYSARIYLDYLTR